MLITEFIEKVNSEVIYSNDYLTFDISKDYNSFEEIPKSERIKKWTINVMFARFVEDSSTENEFDFWTVIGMRKTRQKKQYNETGISISNKGIGIGTITKEYIKKQVEFRFEGRFLDYPDKDECIKRFEIFKKILLEFFPKAILTYEIDNDDSYW